MAKVMKRRKKVWVSRGLYVTSLGKKIEDDEVMIWSDKPKRHKDVSGEVWFSGPNSIFDLCIANFQPITGLKLEAGECVQVEFFVSILKEG